MRRYNCHIDVMGHELSTITEADSHSFNKTLQPEFSLNIRDNLPRIVAYPTPSTSIHLKPESYQVCTPKDSSSESSSSVEKLLVNMGGMGWAISTLQKTKEAFALTSSSSSLDISIKQREVGVQDSGKTTSEASVDVDRSDPNLKDTSPLDGFLDLSSIAGSSSKVEERDYGTSTPIRKHIQSNTGSTFYDLSSLSDTSNNR